MYLLCFRNKSHAKCIFEHKNLKYQDLTPNFRQHNIPLEFSTYQQKLKWLFCTQIRFKICILKFFDVQIYIIITFVYRLKSPPTQNYQSLNIYLLSFSNQITC